jgi:hypothetical protein
MYVAVGIKFFISAAVSLFYLFTLMSKFHCHTVGSVFLTCYIFVVWFASGIWKALELE